MAEIDIAEAQVAAELLALQRRAYAVEAELVESDRIPPLHETLDELRACGERFLTERVDGELAGFVSWKLVGDTLDIHRLAVEPRFFRRGVGRALVRAVLEREPAATRAIVQTGAANTPARTLYEGLGFAISGEREPVPGLRVTLFERPLG